jgi:SNF2 family DNA or RNA helicase
MVRLLKEDVLDLPPKRHEVKWIDATEVSDTLLDWFYVTRKQIVITHRKLRKAKSSAERRKLRERLNALLENVRYEVGVAKFDNVLEYLKSCTSKTLVFAYHHEVIEGLATGLRSAGYNVVTLTGRTRDSTAIIQRFQQDPSCQFFIGNMRAAGIGITLTAASHVVFAELDWTPAAHHQAEDRAHRIGQTQEIQVVHFILDDGLSTDPYIYELLASKESISKRALDRALVAKIEQADLRPVRSTE